MKADLSSSQDSSLSADKENAPPSTPPPRSGGASYNMPTTPPTSSSAPLPADETGDPSLPADLALLKTSIRTNLTQHFSSHPPYTVQRLAELVLRPRAHYRFLPAYLRAVDRVVTVSSPLTVFPLPQAALPATGGLLNGSTPAAAAAAAAAASTIPALGSDESLGGALLTPIPWLRSGASTSSHASSAGSQQGGGGSSQQSQSELISESTEMVDGPNGAGRIETVSVVNGQLSPNNSPTGATASGGSALSPTAQAGEQAPAQSTDDTLRDAGGVTQGELLRQEQEAGIVPVARAPSATTLSSSSSSASTGDGDPVSPPAPAATSTPNTIAGEPPPTTTAAAAAATLSPTTTPEADMSDAPTATAVATAAVPTGAEPAEDPDVPHARGPAEIGVADTGPQPTGRPAGGLDVEAAVGRRLRSAGGKEKERERERERERMMRESCREIRVEVWELVGEERARVLEGWEPPRPPVYTGMHGIKVPLCGDEGAE